MSREPERLRRLLEPLEAFSDRADRIQYLIDVADRFREVPESIAARPFPADHEVPHCESGSFVWATSQDGRLDLHFAVENPQGISAKALAVMLGEGLSGATLEEILAVPEDLPYRIFGRELSMGKSMGLIEMVAMVKAQARRSSVGPAA